MRRWLKISLITLLLAGSAVLCIVRWQAWFGMPPEPKWTGDTIQYVFPRPTSNSASGLTSNSPKDDLTILVLGDIHSHLTRAEYDTLAARVPQAQVVVQTGDWMERGQEYYRQLLLREWTHSALYGLPVISCPGNHDYSKGIHKTLSPVWQETFGENPNYYVDFPQMRLIVMDTNPLTHLLALTRELTWLRETMYSAGDKYIVVLMHHPVLSPAKGRFNPLIYAMFRHALGEADLVLAGHDHSYMRRTPFVVLNTSGNPKPQRTRFATDALDTVPVYGVIHLQSSISNLQFTVHRLDDGTVIDSLYVKHD